MQLELLFYLRCPITKQPFEITILSKSFEIYNGINTEIIETGILFYKECFYPIIKGIPRLLVESIYDYEDFLNENLIDFEERKKLLLTHHGTIIHQAAKKNRRTKESFAAEWKFFNYEKDTTWNAEPKEMFERFLTETNETTSSIKNKIILDAGCGNGLLNNLIANNGANVLGFDFSLSVETAFEKNTNPNAWFVQADVQYLPFADEVFDIVHCSGVLIHTTNTEYSFGCLLPCLKQHGKLSVWLYHPRKDFLHNCFNFIRKYSSKLPLKLQFIIYAVFLFPPSFIIKKLKGNKQNARELMIDILDWMTPEFRWEHTHEEVESWFVKNNFSEIKITTIEMFGFNTIGTKK